MAIKPAYLLQGIKYDLADISGVENALELINYLYDCEMDFEYLRDIKAYALKQTERLNKKHNLNWTVDQYFGSLTEARDNGYCYDTTYDEFSWGE